MTDLALPLPFMSLILVTIGLILGNLKIRDIELQTAGWLGILFCLLMGLLLLPWPPKLFLVVLLIAVPTCPWKHVHIRGTCPPLCIARSACRRSER